VSSLHDGSAVPMAGLMAGAALATLASQPLLRGTAHP